MARTVFCRKLKQELPGLDLPPFPGPKGEEVFNNISKQAWGEWMQHQTTLINEMRLNMMDVSLEPISQSSEKSSFPVNRSIRLKDTSRLANNP